MASWPDKDPNEKLDYTLDWTQALIDSDVIQSSVWSVPEGLNSSSESFDSTKCVVWLDGGTDGVKYTISNRITTSSGRIMERSATLKVKSR